MTRLLLAAALAGAACTTTAAPPPSTTVAPPNPHPPSTTTAPPNPHPPSTTVAPTTTHTHVRTHKRARASRSHVAGDDVWARLAACESGNRPGLRNPPYSGAFQFRDSTWRGMGEAGVAADHSYEHQRAVAQRLQARSGWGQWPACSRKLGLR